MALFFVSNLVTNCLVLYLQNVITKLLNPNLPVLDYIASADQLKRNNYKF